ncbi:ATP-binding protein [Desulfoluna butyratoxydans]|uniref:Histidine kinase-like atpase c-terminal domain n=1 Tax=Desulfoluna butyratoxydans TaxID=231438 RepID=A0A4U8YS14_9BACT|nr:ATP-binding protein [Desulfoluna butyratoxydans]VFQ44073.1 histidine kinase-like atpase c-terminal domain [Desulfoluna butyratoxydans]
MNPFVVTTKANGLEIDMQASLALVDRAVDEVTAFCRQHGISNALFAIIITMREGLTNAVRHGSSLSPDAQVHFSIFLADDTVHMEFEDKGPGFDWQTMIDSQAASDSEGGRGIEIMRKYCHNMAYSKRGCHLHLTIRVTAEKPD